MAGDSGILGFTLGEVGLLLAFALLFLMGVSRQESPDRTVVDSLKDHSEKLENEVDSLSSVLDSLQSAQTPSCQEAGIASSFLFTATVVGEDRFRVEGNIYAGIDELLEHSRQALAEAERADCMHQIWVQPGREVSLGDYRQGVKKLARHFYYGEL